MRSATVVLAVLSLATGIAGHCDVDPDDALQAACVALKIQVALLKGLSETGPANLGWFCDPSTFQVKGFYIIALRSARPAPYSNLMGWYAVQRRTHAVYAWDVAEMKIGSSLRQPQH